ncbi:MAG: hypothetical protein N2Z22_02260 [Turneriella sp.]|nr:hypothetical protein [Turneriella sp.]
MPEHVLAYWNSGKAEIARYSLEQARYGALRRGEMVVISVTEPFHAERQVKAETPESQKNAVNVLKVQQMRRFATGIYDYQLVTTSFVPFASSLLPALKITGSAVDWCGQSWLQLNLRGSQYQVSVRSYFENPGDQDYTTKALLSEDALWQYIRLAPTALPQGEVVVIPSLFSARLRHHDPAAITARAELLHYAKLQQSEYTLVFHPGTGDERKVSFIFEQQFPHQILEYRESYFDKTGSKNPIQLTSVARLKNIRLSAYWQENGPEHRALRQKLGISGFD